MQPESIVRRRGVARGPCAAAAAAVCLTLAGIDAAPGNAPGGAASAQTIAVPARPGWREAPEYVALFAPGAQAASYRAFVSTLPIDALLRTLAGDPSLLRPAGAWEARPLGVLDAFGRSGPYDRLELARLFGGRGVELARGPRAAGGRVVESWSLVSPYPDPSLERIEAGTLIIVLSLGGPEGPPRRGSAASPAGPEDPPLRERP